MNNEMRILLGSRKQSDIYTLIDHIDFKLVNCYKWHCTSGYAAATINRRDIVYMHRLILGLHKGDDRECDHINRNKLDNRRSNLRIVTKSQNNMNVKWTKKGSSRYKGVHWHKQRKKWKAQIRADNHIYYLGVFINEIDAAIAYDNFAKKIHGEFACLNFPGEFQTKVSNRS